MAWRMIDRLAEMPEGSYAKTPVEVYRRMLVNSGCCMVDQWIPDNPLSMRTAGYDSSTTRGATTGTESIVLDGRVIDSPEAAVVHIEQGLIPAIQRQTAEFNEESLAAKLVAEEQQVQEILGSEILKAPYMEFARFPTFAYTTYGYENYFMAYALYPEVMERLFKTQAEYALQYNTVAARLIIASGLPPYIRLDSDMADSRGTLVDIASLDRIWFPHFERCIQPFIDADITLIWHCDGNLMQMLPRLLEVGLKGFQGFQYEDGMDYERICKMKSREGDGLLIIAGVSVTRTLPYGTPEDIRQEMRWLVDNGPRQGLFLGCSSSITPGVPWENLKTLVEGFWYYRKHGRC